jgi:hypothetical protein
VAIPLAITLATSFIIVNFEKVLEHVGLDRVLLSAPIRSVVTNPYFVAATIFAAGIVATLWFQHLWKGKTKVRAIEIDINVFGFMQESVEQKGTYNLFLNLKARDSVALTRISVVFNRPGGNDSYEIAAYPSPRQMHQGETRRLVLMHYRRDVGTFWGDVDQLTESRKLNHLTRDQLEVYRKRGLHHDGTHYCQLIVQHLQGEERTNFTVLIGLPGERPSVLTDRYHKDYDPDRFIPAQGTFAS